MEDKRGSAEAIKQIVEIGRRISVKEMSEVAGFAAAAGGSLVAIEGDDDWCGTGRLRFKWPPKRNEFVAFLDKLVAARINLEILINGIPDPEEITVQIGRGIGR